MADEAVERIRIEGTPERCFEVVCDFENYPRWATDVKTAEIVDRDATGRASRVKYEVSAMNLTIGYTLDYDYSAAPDALSWTLVQSDMIKRLDGTYRFDPDGSATAVTYRLLVDLALPLPGFMKKKAAEKIASNAMREFKKFVESGGENA
jgi:ribosome-associated toxin RatA of RatAB toxin-antitoxin module